MSLKELRRAANLTQDQLAFLLDVSPMTVRRWEQGQTVPDALDVRKIAHMLRVQESDVIEAVVCAKRAS